LERCDWLTVDQPQVKGAHVRFKKLVQIGESRFFPVSSVKIPSVL